MSGSAGLGAKPGAGLLANAVGQPTGRKLVKRVRQQAGSYGCDVRQPASSAGMVPASKPAPTGVMLCPLREILDRRQNL
jgi:hypothetical protein